jgi:hypothetical protein
LPDAEAAKSRPLRLILVLAGVALVLVAALAWLNRKMLAREAIGGWLRAKGVASQVDVQAIGPSTFVARLRIGDASDPVFVAEQVEVGYRLRAGGLEVRSVHLTRPELRAAVRNGRLQLGELDPLVQEFLRRPPRPDAGRPRIDVDRGVLRLATDYGPVRATADLQVVDGRLMSLQASTAPARLRGEGFDLALGTAVLRETTRGDRISVTVDLPITRASLGGKAVTGGRLSLDAQLPYPDLKSRRGDGGVVGQALLTAQRLDLDGRRLETVRLGGAFHGQARGGLTDLDVRGRLTADLDARRGVGPEGSVGALQASVGSEQVIWTSKDGDRLAGQVTVQAEAQGVRAGDLELSTISVNARGPVDASRRDLGLDLTGSVAARGSYEGLGPMAPDDGAEIAALKRAVGDFRLAAPQMRMTARAGALSLTLPEPLRVTGGGGAAILSGRGNAPVLGPNGGQFRLVVQGGGLPRIAADIARAETTADGARLQGRVTARGSFGFVTGAELEASGQLALAKGGATFRADRCVVLGAAELDFGANDITDLGGRLCPTGDPVFVMRNGGWRVNGRAEGVRAAAPFIQARVVGGVGRVVAEGRGAATTARIRVATARQEDMAPEPRFNPFLMGGEVTLSEYIWRGDLTFRRPGGDPLGTARVTHDGRLGLGVAVIETETLEFSEGGLQPSDLSPMAAQVGSPAVGTARFSGRFDWAIEGSSSRGVLTIPGLDFQSPAGPVKGLRGQIAFSSLAPLAAAPGQELTVDEVQSVMLLSGLRARFEVLDSLLRVEGGEAAVGGGRIRVETLEIPLAPGAPTRGVVHLDGVQLQDLVEASPFGDKVDLDAKVSGRIPFELQDGRLRISGGDLKADQPGRLSIDRSALSGVSADTEIAAPGAPDATVADPNATFTDFAYQAMENLAFDTLSVSVNSQADGRLGMLFHIIGQHDPPQRQQIRLTLLDLLQQRFLGRKLPLPSGTGVNLTLDTTLNLDDLMGDWAEYQKVRGSGPVQP